MSRVVLTDVGSGKMLGAVLRADSLAELRGLYARVADGWTQGAASSPEVGATFMHRIRRAMAPANEQEPKLDLPDGTQVTTNRIESFWTGLKLQRYGTHHAVTRKRPHRYLSEVE